MYLGPLLPKICNEAHISALLAGEVSIASAEKWKIRVTTVFNWYTIIYKPAIKNFFPFTYREHLIAG